MKNKLLNVLYALLAILVFIILPGIAGALELAAELR